MGLKDMCSVFFLSILVLSLVVLSEAAAAVKPAQSTEGFGKSNFSKDFVFGSSSAAYQVKAIKTS